MNRLIKVINTVLIIYSLITIISATTVTSNGQISTWLIANKETTLNVRYIPELSFKEFLNNEKLDIELKLLLQNDDLDTYRLWFRYSVPKYFIRLGLQKINFGTSKVLRSLNWFDTLDPQDPFKLTDGVEALLVKYFFMNNTNIWIWAQEDKQIGSRLQVPVSKGELALSYNHDTDTSLDKYGVDAIFDLGIGTWFETTIADLKNNKISQQLTLGTDYTLANGIYIMYEHFLYFIGDEYDNMDSVSELSAISLSYNINVLDNIRFIGYYNWKEEKPYTYISFERKYDNFQFNIISFSNPTNASLSGNGAQLMITYNY